VHDTVWFELQGRPSVFVASSAFEDAARGQARALGLDETRFVLVPHPIQDANDAEMRARADAIVDAVLQAISGVN
jgi:hypothetical protein